MAKIRSARILFSHLLPDGCNYQHVVSYPISQGRQVNIVAFITVPGGEGKQLEGPAMIDVAKQEVLDQYEGWEPEVLNLLSVCLLWFLNLAVVSDDSSQCIETPSRWAISHMRGLPTYVDGRVALLGDSVRHRTQNCLHNAEHIGFIARLTR